MIIIEKTIGKSKLDLRRIIYADLHFILNEAPDTNGVDVWIHKEKEGREVILNTGDHPLLPGHTSFEDYDETGIQLNLFLLSPDVTMDYLLDELGV